MPAPTIRAVRDEDISSATIISNDNRAVDDTLYLGIDASTQGVTAIAIDAGTRRVVLEHALNFDADLPRYGTSHGVLTSNDGRTVVAPAAMWAEALDLLMSAVAASGLDLSRVLAVSGAAQQHASVYLVDGFDAALRGLSPAAPIAEQNRSAADATGLPRLARLQHQG